MTTFATEGAVGARRHASHIQPAAIEEPPALDVTDLVALIGHELCTPLTTISAAMELIESAPGQRPNALTATVRRQIARLLALFEASLRAAEIVGGGRVDRDARASVPDVLKRLRDAWSASEQRLRLRVECAPSVPPVAMEARALEILLNNLLVNAFKHSGGMQITCAVEECCDRVHVTVSDDGRGIPAHLRKSMFELGARGDARAGSGLGLYVARKLVRAFGGDLRLVPACRGAAFLVTLPVGEPCGPSGEQPS
ncbi:MAG: HAMP domain-containing histidine kinase [Chloroflexota bacterium]|nr:HAMP domain-containing histidine kinase [Chloroflexota bacterium]